MDRATHTLTYLLSLSLFLAWAPCPLLSQIPLPDPPIETSVSPVESTDQDDSQPVENEEAISAKTSTHSTDKGNPVDLFRHLIESSKTEREAWLSNQEDWRRKRISEGLAEFDQLSPEHKAKRLREMELRYFLLPLLNLHPDERTFALAQVPEHLQELAKEQLMMWDLLPETARQAALAREQWRKKRPGSTEAEIAPLPPSKSLQSWNNLSETEKAEIKANFQSFFTLSTTSQSKTLSMLDQHQRRELESILNRLKNKSIEDRRKIVDYFIQFSKLDPIEKGTFIQKASTWQKMSPEERELWKEVIRQNTLLPPSYSK